MRNRTDQLIRKAKAYDFASVCEPDMGEFCGEACAIQTLSLQYRHWFSARSKYTICQSVWNKNAIQNGADDYYSH